MVASSENDTFLALPFEIELSDVESTDGDSWWSLNSDSVFDDGLSLALVVIIFGFCCCWLLCCFWWLCWCWCCPGLSCNMLFSALSSVPGSWSIDAAEVDLLRLSENRLDNRKRRDFFLVPLVDALISFLDRSSVNTGHSSLNVRLNSLHNASVFDLGDFQSTRYRRYTSPDLSTFFDSRITIFLSGFTNTTGACLGWVRNVYICTGML